MLHIMPTSLHKEVILFMNYMQGLTGISNMSATHLSPSSHLSRFIQ